METESRKFIQTLERALAPHRIKESIERDGCIFVEVAPADVVAACTASMSSGAIFDSAFVSAASPIPADTFTLYYLLRAPAVSHPMGRMLVIHATGKTFSVLSSSVNAALWDERKIMDLTGLKLAGIPDSRPLIFHAESGMPHAHPVGGRHLTPPASTDYPMPGTGAHGEFEVSVGPVHAGIIEPGHFRFHVVGEQINKLEARLFYMHRGIEKAAEGQAASAIMPLIEQISGDESAANSIAYCIAVERALGISVPPRAESIRAIFGELERIYSHLADLGGMPTDVGFYLSASRFAAMREDMMRLNQRVSQSRFLRGRIIVGGVHADIDHQMQGIIKHALADFLQRLDNVERLTLGNSTFLDRVFLTGVVSKRTALDLAVVGPAARAGEISCDLRRALPYSAYALTTVNAVNEPLEKNSDVLSRFNVKLAEVKESARLIRWLIEHMPAGPLNADAAEAAAHSAHAGKTASSRSRPPLLGVGWAEAPRGGCTFLVELNSKGVIKRLAGRTASFRNWRSAEKAVLGNIVPDFPLINKSLNLSYAGTDM